MPPPTIERRLQESQSLREKVTELIKEVDRLLADERARTSEGAWRLLLGHESLWNLDTRDEFQRRLLERLALNGSGLTAQVWSILEREYQWSEQRSSLYRSLPPDLVDVVLDYIDYLPAVEQAERLCHNRCYRDAIEMMEPIVCRLRGELGSRARLVLARSHLKVRSLDRAEELLAQVVQADPRCIPAYLLRAVVFRTRGRLLEAKEAYLAVLRLDPDHREAAVGVVTVQGELAAAPRPSSAPVGPRATASPVPVRPSAYPEPGAGRSSSLIWVFVALAFGPLALSVRADSWRMLFVTIPWSLMVAAAFVWLRRHRAKEGVVELRLADGAEDPDPKLASSTPPELEGANLGALPDFGYRSLETGRFVTALFAVLLVMLLIALAS
jgi:tetratricopeptide (TPR) repeat protein